MNNRTLSKIWAEERRNGFPPDIDRWRRLVAARKAGCSLEEIAERFGLKDRASAKFSHYRAKKQIARYSDDA